MKFGLGPSTEKNGIPRIESVAPAAANGTLLAFVKA